MSRFALSRKEEDSILSLCRTEALRACQTEVSNFSACSEGRTISVTWACREQFRAMQNCMSPHCFNSMSEAKLDEAKRRFFREGGLPKEATPPQK
ncbi:hypothetical protein BMF94_2965 [Rhodotorula taiwanensis]|uniref:COX assembly mitochondrial protein n=1 Tax=Rhodotorula taiwanensis TaxID=741276 RepID=A0A2S5BBM3_9BASI|nr:hypothetical protein BMF94_2965 [Rhodotorula taiwanensis]